MDVGVVLQAALSPNQDERKAAEQRLEQIQYAPQHLLKLLQIIVDANSDIALRQVAAIHFKNFIAKNWSSSDHHHHHHQISLPDKDLVRNHTLLFLPQLPPLLRVQIGECLKTIIHSDYPDHWPHLLHWINHNLQDDQHLFAALFLLRILSSKYELVLLHSVTYCLYLICISSIFFNKLILPRFKSDEERTPVTHIVEETFPHLLNILTRLVHIANPSLEVADFIKLICKIFWSSIYVCLLFF